MPNVTPEESAALAISPSFVKWALGLISMAIVGVFGWIWATDRAVRALMQAQAERDARTEERDEDREKREAQQEHDREKWRREIVQWLQNIESKVDAHSLAEARRKGAEDERERARRAGPR